MQRTPSISQQQFVGRWAGMSLNEMAAYVSHFEDVCRLVGHALPTDVDTAGEFFTFQYGVQKLGATRGSIPPARRTQSWPNAR